MVCRVREAILSRESSRSIHEPIQDVSTSSHQMGLLQARLPPWSMATMRNHGLGLLRSQPFSSSSRSNSAEVMALPIRMQVREVPQTTVM